MQYYTLFQLNNHLKKVLGQYLAPSYWVVAEIGEMRINQRGHCYMELVEKEHDHLHAKIKANLWSSSYRNINSYFKSVTGHPLRSGMKILAQVSVEYHEIYGLSLNIKDIDPNFTVGERARKRKQAIDRLIAGGIFYQNKGLPLPLVPQKIALISSPTAAGFTDFMHQLTENSQGYHFKVTLFQATMQGNEAVASIRSAFGKILPRAGEFDTVAIVRGGGAQVDLDCFDTYEMASAVALFPLPVLSGIGHERDQTVVDLVAHTQLKTPTAVAAFLTGKLESFEEAVNRLTSRMVTRTENHLRKQAYDLGFLHQKLQFAYRQVSSSASNRLAGLKERVLRASRVNYERQALFLDHLGRSLASASQKYLEESARKLEGLKKNIDHLNPETILQRGYSITHVRNIFITRLPNIKAGDKITTLTHNKKIQSTINQIKDHE